MLFRPSESAKNWNGQYQADIVAGRWCIYQSERDAVIVVAESSFEVDSGKQSESDHDGDQNHEDDIDDDQARTAPDWMSRISPGERRPNLWWGKSHVVLCRTQSETSVV